MDSKTLEYMGERVDKARKLEKKISKINDRIDWLTKDDHTIRNISLADRQSRHISVGEYGDADEIPTLVPQITDAVIVILTEYRNSLQAEIDEL